MSISRPGRMARESISELLQMSGIGTYHTQDGGLYRRNSQINSYRHLQIMEMDALQTNQCLKYLHLLSD